MTLTPLLGLLATMNPVVAHKLHAALDFLPPRYLFGGAVAGLLLGFLLRRRGASNRVYGTVLGLGGLSLVLWVVAMFISTFFVLVHDESSGHRHHAATHSCSAARPCPEGERCVVTAGRGTCERDER